jgi:hypothetical protein
MPRRGTRRRGRTSPAASPTAPGAAGQHGAPTWISSGCWAWRALGRAGGRSARPSPAWARRHRRGGGAGGLTRAGARKRERDGVRGGVHARQVTTAGAGLGSRRGVTAVFMVEPGSTPWVAASAAPAIGSRECVWVHGGSRARSRRPRTRFPLPSPTQDRAWGYWSQRGRGGAGRSRCSGKPYAREQGPRLNLDPGFDARTCWGARWLGASGLRGVVRERECERLSAASRARAACTASKQRRGKARQMARASVKAATPVKDRIPGWLDGLHHQRRRGAAGVLPRLDGRGVHRREEAASSPRWPMAEVERVGEERRSGWPARKKRR